MNLTNIKTLLRITGTSEDDILNVLLDNATASVLLYLGVDELPPSIEFIVTEMVVVRYNKLMVEAITTTNNVGVAYTYGKEDLFPYMDMLDMYARKSNAFRML
jgi:hypothetical protein